VIRVDVIHEDTEVEIAVPKDTLRPELEVDRVVLRIQNAGDRRRWRHLLAQIEDVGSIYTCVERPDRQVSLVVELEIEAVGMNERQVRRARINHSPNCRRVDAARYASEVIKLLGVGDQSLHLEERRIKLQQWAKRLWICERVKEIKSSRLGCRDEPFEANLVIRCAQA